MKKLSTLLISSTFLLITAVSCRNNDDRSVTGVTVSPTSTTMVVDSVFPLAATVLPTDATNQTVTWSSSNTDVVTVLNGVLTATAVGVANITVTTEDGNFTATSEIEVYEILSNFCNTRTPSWGESLGVVSFYTNETWTIEGNGISQIWSDAVTAVNCQKTTFAGGSSGNFNADCRSNPDFPGDLFSWCAVVRFAHQLCPYPWRVPTNEDFRNLDIAMGGTGNSRVDLDFVNANYITRWGGRFGGGCISVGTLSGQDILGSYWSQTGFGATNARDLTFGTAGNINPWLSTSRSHGFSLRCVR